MMWASVIKCKGQREEGLGAEVKASSYVFIYTPVCGGDGGRTEEKKNKKKEHTAAIPKTDLPSATHDLHVTFSRLICTSLTAIDLTRFMQMTP